MRESILARLARFTVRSCLKPALQPTFPVPVQRCWANIATRTLSVPVGVRFSQSSLGGVPTEIVRAKSNAGSVGAVLFLHGGAFMIGSPVSHRSITGRLAKHTDATIFVPDYRLAPEHPFPAALDDVLISYRSLFAQGCAPERIAIAGDSAGGGLVLSLCLRLRSEGLAQPACAVVISPWADLTLTRLAPVVDDALLRAAWLNQGAAAYLQGHSARDPLVSPLLADLAGLPPTLVQSAPKKSCVTIRGVLPGRCLKTVSPSPTGSSRTCGMTSSLCRPRPRSNASGRINGLTYLKGCAVAGYSIAARERALKQSRAFHG